MSISLCVIPLLLFNFIEIEKTGLTLRKRRRWQRNTLPLEDWGRKGMEIEGGWSHMCMCHTQTLNGESRGPWGWPGESTGYVVDGAVQELFGGLDGGTEWSKDADHIKRSPVNRKRPLDHDWAMKHTTNSSAAESPEQPASSARSQWTPASIHPRRIAEDPFFPKLWRTFSFSLTPS